MNNRAIRTAMFRIGLRQYQLAEILGCSEASVSLMLRHELSRAEQKRIVDLIKEYEASDEKREHVMSEISTLSELNQEHENEVIVKLTSDHIKMKGGEYVQDLVRWTDASVG